MAPASIQTTRAPQKNEKIGLGLPGMRERAIYVGGVLTVKSARRQGTAVEARIPLPPAL